MSDPIYCWNLPLTHEQMIDLLECIGDSIRLCSIEHGKSTDQHRHYWVAAQDKTRRFYADVPRQRIEVKP